MLYRQPGDLALIWYVAFKSHFSNLIPVHECLVVQGNIRKTALGVIVTKLW